MAPLSEAETRRNLWDRAANTWRRLVDSATIKWTTSTPGQASASIPTDAEPTFADLTLTGSLRTPLAAELTIASGVITVTSGYHPVDTEADGASDDLDTINGGSDGMIVTLRAANTDRTVVVKDGTGNIQIAGDMTLDNVQDTITLRFDSALSAWLEIARAASGA